MVFDIITACIIIASAIYYFRKGFANAILSAIEWFIAVVIALLACTRVAPFLIESSGIGIKMSESYEEKLAGTQGDFLERMVQTFQGWASGSTDYVTTVSGENLTTIFLSILIFTLVTLVIKLLTLLFARLFPKESYSDFGAFVNRLGGLVVGVCMGLFYVLFLLTVLMAIMVRIPSGDVIDASLQSSFLTGGLFSDNFLFALLKNLFL